MAVRIKQRDKTLQDANEADALKRWIDKVADTRIDLQMKFPKYGKKHVFVPRGELWCCTMRA